MAKLKIADIHGQRIVQGDSFSFLGTVPGQFDAVITDPPYSSGGLYRADRAGSSSEKYVQQGQTKTYDEFSGESKSELVQLKWQWLWMEQAHQLTRQAGYLLVFSDWRMLGVTIHAMQMAGWTQRGLCVWDKGLATRAPHKGYARHQCEYIVWGTKGACKKATHAGPFPGCYQYPVNHHHKNHMTAKPVGLLRDLVRWLPTGSSILDPFAGGGSTAAACLLEGSQCVTVEKYPHIHAKAVSLVQEAATAPGHPKFARRPYRKAEEVQP